MRATKVIIIGAGASGLVAAIVAARNGAKVTLLERKNRVGKKILATGNGRCNLSNARTTVEYFHGENPSFACYALEEFSVSKTLDFFKSLGIHPIEKDKGKIYPASEQASSVLDVLRYEVERLKVQVHCDEEIQSVQVKDRFIVTSKNGHSYYGNKLILAAGGCSSPDLGSDGSGFRLAKQLGHTLVDPFPSLIQLKSDATYLKQIKGVKIQGEICICNKNKETIRREAGEVLFTDYGVSGPPVLQISRSAAVLLKKGQACSVILDFFPNLNTTELDALLLERVTMMSYKTIQDNMIGLINKRLIPVIIKESKIPLSKKSAEISKQERCRLLKTLKRLELTITGTHQWNQSQVTAGGVRTDEVDERTMMSKRVPNLFFAGELLDIDGDCGGYNLQWAWSSGMLAGRSSSI